MTAPLIVEIAVQAKYRAGTEPLKQALLRLRDRDDSFVTSEGYEAGQIIISASDEGRLNAAIDFLRSDTGEPLDVGAPQVAYREYLEKSVDVDYTHKKQSGGTGQFGRVKVKVTPGKRGSGITFKDEIKSGNIPLEFVPAIEKGMRETAASGSLIGFPIIDFDIVLYDGAYHDGASSALAFEIAGREAMREVARKAGVKLLEPIMKMVVLTPDHRLHATVESLLRRGGKVESQSRSSASLIVALCPMASLFGYEADLASASEGEGRFSMMMDHYGAMPWSGEFPDDTVPAAAALRA